MHYSDLRELIEEYVRFLVGVCLWKRKNLMAIFLLTL